MTTTAKTPKTKAPAKAKSTPETPKKSVYEIVTGQVIEMLEKGVVPWRKPWNSREPRNGKSGRAYHGLNALLLGLQPYSDPRYFTFKQAQEKGGCVRKGEKGHMVIFWKMLETKNEETGEKELIPLLRYSTVFNATQIDGLELPSLDQIAFEPMDKAQAVVDSYLGENGPKLTHGGSRACYSPSRDEIQMPTRGSFVSVESYYSAIFHEMSHSTGHADRLGRFQRDQFSSHDEDYCREELVAELGAAFLNNLTGISGEMESSVAYLESWIKALRGDSRLLIQAASKAKKAVDLIMGVQAETAETTETTTEEGAAA